MLEVRDLSKAFGGLKAVDQASLDVRSGEIVGLIGPNGAGKTTLFATIAGFHKPDAGRITFAGPRHHRPGAAPHLRRRHGAHLPDHPAVRAHQRAREHHGRRLFPHRRPPRGGAASPRRSPTRSAWATSSTSRAPTSPSPAASGSSSPARSPPRPAPAAARRGDGRPQPDRDRRDRRGDPRGPQTPASPSC